MRQTNKVDAQCDQCDVTEIEGLRDVAMAINFGTKMAITGFVLTIATRQFVVEGV